MSNLPPNQDATLPAARRFNADLLMVARNWRAISQSQLAKDLKVSQGHLSKIENRLAEPEPELVSRMAQRLQFPESFFFESHRAIGGPMSAHAMFRKKAAIAAGVMDQLVAGLNLRIIHIRKLLNPVEVRSELVLPHYEIDTGHGTPKEIAEKVRRAWLLPRGPIRNLTELVEATGTVVMHVDFDEADVDGVTVHLPHLPPIILLNRNRPADRMRFSLAHELGHLVMHSQPSDSIETEANDFASELLMPAQDFIASCMNKITINELARLKSIWRVAMQAALYRVTQLELISKSQAGYLWKQISALGYRKSEPEHTRFEHEVPQGVGRLLQLHLSDLQYSVGELAQSVHLHEEEFRTMYGIRDPGPRLRLVK